MARKNMSVSSRGFSTNVKPAVCLSILPASGEAAGGTAVLITGRGFQPGAQVAIGGVACTSPVVTSSSSMTAVTGAHAQDGDLDVVVTNPPGGSHGGMVATGAALFSYTA